MNEESAQLEARLALHRATALIGWRAGGGVHESDLLAELAARGMAPHEARRALEACERQRVAYHEGETWHVRWRATLQP